MKCWYREELRSPYEDATPQPSIGQCRAPMDPEMLSSTGVGAWRTAPKVATALASYRIEKPRNPQNRRTIGINIGTFYFWPILPLFFPYFVPVCLFVFLFSGCWGLFYSVAGRRDRNPKACPNSSSVLDKSQGDAPEQFKSRPALR